MKGIILYSCILQIHIFLKMISGRISPRENVQDKKPVNT